MTLAKTMPGPASQRMRDRLTGRKLTCLLVALLLLFLAWPGSQGDLAQVGHLFPLAYYSFMTITSVGYGDIVPVTTAARALTALEALVGQIYLVVLVSRLVGIHIAQQMERRQGA